MSVNLGKKHPDLYHHVESLSQAAEEAMSAAGLSEQLTELVKLRVSQINGCAFCLRLHTRSALSKGESTDRLAVLAAWWESQYFDEQGEAALSLAESITSINQVPTHPRDTSVLTDEQISAISWLSIVMNAWNRIAITSHYPVSA